MKRTLGALMACGVGTVAYARAEAERFVLRRVTVPVLPPDVPSLRVLHLSDLHMTGNRWSRRRARWIRHLVGTEPDVVVTTGDNMATPEGLDTVLDALEPFWTLPGVFVFGSNDYFSARFPMPLWYLADRIVPSLKAWREQRLYAHARSSDLPWTALRDALMTAGWTDLNNARSTVDVGGVVVEFTGLDDPHIGRNHLPGRQDGLASGATAVNPGLGVTIGVVHAPYLSAVNTLADDGAHLIMAGHTHGGQIALPGLGAIVSNCDLPPRYARGLHQWPPHVTPSTATTTWLHVSAGLGTSPYTPWRLACPPEATLLTLVPATSSL